MHTDAHRYDRWPRLTAIALRWKLYRPFKILRGVLRTYIFKKHYSSPIDHDWWDSFYVGQDISDAQTIAPGTTPFPTMLHYNSIENIILAHLFNQRITIEGCSVLDLGSGAGHWIDFYRSLGAAHIDGVEISTNAATALNLRYAGISGITIHNCPAAEFDSGRQFDVINAIGVMFHIVDDGEFERTVTKLTDLLRPGGLLIVGGHFGWLDNLNVQFDASGRINKRLRSLRHWRKLLSACATVRVYRNRAFRLIDAPLPENNILMACK
jgi:Predicted methyltransferase (contains TPR repeat)